MLQVSLGRWIWTVGTRLSRLMSFWQIYKDTLGYSVFQGEVCTCPFLGSVLYMISTVSPSHCFPAAADHMEHVRTPPATVVYASSDILGLNPAQPIRPLCAC